MHYSHIHLVHASDKDDAKEVIEGSLESYKNSVYDYYNIRQICLPDINGINKVNKMNRDKVWKHIEIAMRGTRRNYKYQQELMIKCMERLKLYDLLSIEIGDEKYHAMGYHLRILG